MKVGDLLGDFGDIEYGSLGDIEVDLPKDQKLEKLIQLIAVTKIKSEENTKAVEELTDELKEHKKSSEKYSSWLTRLTVVLAILTFLLILQGFGVF